MAWCVRRLFSWFNRLAREDAHVKCAPNDDVPSIVAAPTVLVAAAAQPVIATELVAGHGVAVNDLLSSVGQHVLSEAGVAWLPEYEGLGSNGIRRLLAPSLTLTDLPKELNGMILDFVAMELGQVHEGQFLEGQARFLAGKRPSNAVWSLGFVRKVDATLNKTEMMFINDATWQRLNNATEVSLRMVESTEKILNEFADGKSGVNRCLQKLIVEIGGYFKTIQYLPNQLFTKDECYESEFSAINTHFDLKKHMKMRFAQALHSVICVPITASRTLVGRPTWARIFRPADLGVRIELQPDFEQEIFAWNDGICQNL